MALPASDVEPGGLKQRVFSALILGPLALIAVFLGHPFLEIVVAAFALAMAWEWSRLCSAGRFGPEGWIIAASLLVVFALTLARRYDLALALTFAGTAGVYVVARILGHRAALVVAVAPAAVGLAAVSFVWLRDRPDAGFAAVVWLVGAVWTTDIAAYFVGRRIGGPRLAPRISPRKTWSGLVGGVCCAALWGLLWGVVPETSAPWQLAVLGAGVAVVAQAGDLAISVLKRRFGAKDASGLIPGHGGVLDRCDGFVTAAPVVAGVVWVAKGIVWPPL